MVKIEDFQLGTKFRYGIDKTIYTVIRVSYTPSRIYFNTDSDLREDYLNFQNYEDKFTIVSQSTQRIIGRLGLIKHV